MRIDKFLTHTGRATRTEAGRLLRQGAVTVDGVPVKSASAHIDPETQVVALHGQVIPYQVYTYLMLHKPDGYISATDDPRQKTVLELLPPELQRIGLFPCGRLDRDTVGLLILTNDGALSHRLLSPRHHVKKTYAFTCERPFSQVAQMEQGVTLEDGYVTLPCKVTMQAPTQGEITLTEGKYHQIKRMFEAFDNRITSLCRIRFGGIDLDPALPCGDYRPLTEAELALLRSHT